MQKDILQLRLHLRVWRDSQISRLWWLAYRESDHEIVISFPDSAALGDFIAERIGLKLFDTKPRIVAVEEP